MCLESSHTNLIVYLYKNAVIDYGLISWKMQRILTKTWVSMIVTVVKINYFSEYEYRLR